SWYNLAKEADGKTVWSETYLDYGNRNSVLTVARAVKVPSGGIIGVVAIHFDVSDLSAVISKSKIGSQGFVMLLNSDGSIMATRNDFMLGEKTFGDDFKNVIASKGSGKFDYSIHGEDYALEFGTLENNMVLVTAVSEKEITDNLWKNYWPILASGIGCLIIFGFFTYLLALKGIKPVQKLVVLMKQAEKGNYNVCADIKEYKEINSLSNSFNSMIESIHKRDQKIKRLAYYDSLTGLSNREKLILNVESMIKIAIENDKSGALIYIDIDNFKQINDTMGHTVGDRVLVHVAGRLKNVENTKTISARIGGDEFIILVKEISSKDMVMSIANKLVEIFKKPVIVENKFFNITASIGVVLFPEQGITVEELLKKADMAMYRAKEKGKNCYQIFDDSMQREIVAIAEIENGIRFALKNDEFVLFYQPKYNVLNKKIDGMEALLRCKVPSLNQFSTLKIIKTAEKTGLIIGIDKWVLKKASTFAKKINVNTRDIIKISINISAVHIMHADFVQNVKDIIFDVGVNPAFIEIEITETVMMEAFGSNMKKLQELKKIGIDIHLDDFGSGYSSLNYLQNLPIDYVKIDKTFVDTLENSTANGKITETIVELAHNLGLKVIAEGVEKKEQMDLLAKYNCDIIQGFYLGRPMSQEDMEKLIRFKD
ncbi:MAG: EAL domain-containing protein, partial [Eubacteriales bacterium]